MGNGLFIVVDGIDGSGKSEIIKMLHNYLFSKNKKYRILTTREPTNGKYGNQIREMLRNEKDPQSSSIKLMELFIKDREKEKFEKLEFMKKIRDNFLKLPNLLKDNIKIINSNKTLNEVFEDVRKEADKLI